MTDPHRSGKLRETKETCGQTVRRRTPGQTEWNWSGVAPQVELFVFELDLKILRERLFIANDPISVRSVTILPHGLRIGIDAQKSRGARYRQNLHRHRFARKRSPVRSVSNGFQP